MIRKITVLILTLILMTAVLTVGSSTGQSETANVNQVIPQAPDISVTNITFSEDDLDEGDNVTITVTVKNNESIPLSDLGIILYSNAQEFYRFKNKTLAPMSSDEFTMQWKAQGGTQNISAVLSIRGNQLMTTLYSTEIYVEPEPMGDIYTPILVLSLILIFVFSMIVVPSIRVRM